MAHEQAMTETLAFIETHAAHTRTGADGIAQIDTPVWSRSRFTHYDSRAGTRTCTPTWPCPTRSKASTGSGGPWNARGLHAMAVTASEHYNTRVQAHVSDRLGVVVRGPPDRTRQAAGRRGSPASRNRCSSTSPAAALNWRPSTTCCSPTIGPGTAATPTSPRSRALAEQANLATRRGKAAPRSLAQDADAWRADLADTFGPDALTRSGRRRTHPSASQEPDPGGGWPGSRHPRTRPTRRGAGGRGPRRGRGPAFGLDGVEPALRGRTQAA